MNKKFYILIQQMDDYEHFAAHVLPVRAYDNLIARFQNFPPNTTANIYPTKKEAVTTAQILNEQWRARGVHKYDFMPDGTTPAPF